MDREKFFRRGVIALLTTGLLASCNEVSLGLFSRPYPHQQYYNKLKDHGLSTTLVGTEWVQSAESSLQNAVEAEVPFSMKGVFVAERIEALSWQFPLQEGATVVFKLSWNTPDSSRLFMDVFQREGNQWKYIASAGESELYLEYESEETSQYLVRLQPELLAKGQYELKVSRKPTYSVFPVYGKDGRAIWSVFGDSRSRGTRSHEGVDIFAERGTPVLSPVKSVVSSVRNGGLGGKSVFVRDRKRGHSLYFAHLDSQAVSVGNMLEPGDTIGFVGNTGNARHTAPHLHFGIYKGLSGAIDPFPFVNDRFQQAEDIEVDFPPVDYFIVSAARANFRVGPGTTYPVSKQLKRQNIVFPKARNKDWYLVELPDHKYGYIHTSLLDLPRGESVQDTVLWLFWDPFAGSPDSISVQGRGMQILGNYAGYELVIDESKSLFWKRS